MKQQLAIHGRDHRLGGADPAPFELPWCYATNEAVTQAVTADAEVLFSVCKTNDRRTFRWDPDDAEGILVYRRGLYRVWAQVVVESADIAVAREIYVTAELLSSGPLFGVGHAYGETHFHLGPGQNESSVSVVTASNTISKTVLNYVAMNRIVSVDPTDPFRFAVILDHLGTDFDLSSSLDSTLTVERVGDIGDDTPAPTDMSP